MVLNEERTLPGLLASVEGAFDEVVAVDVGSTDGTVALIEEWAKRTSTPCRVSRFEQARDDFAIGRNYADSLASSDWVCWADADDIVRGATRLSGLAARAHPKITAFRFDYAYAHDELGNCVCRGVRTRLVRRGAATWLNPIHEAQQIDGKSCDIGRDVAEWVHRRKGTTVSQHRRNGRIVAAWVAAEPNNSQALFHAANEVVTAPICLDVEQALSYFRRYLDVQPQWIDQRCLVVRYVCQLLIFKGAHGQSQYLDDANEMARAAISERPDWTDNYLTLAEIADQRSDADEAQAWARRVIAQGPPQTSLQADPRDYGERPQAIIDGVRVVPAWWSIAFA
jgi:hypothetical protein